MNFPKKKQALTEKLADFTALSTHNIDGPWVRPRPVNGLSLVPPATPQPTDLHSPSMPQGDDPSFHRLGIVWIAIWHCMQAAMQLQVSSRGPPLGPLLDPTWSRTWTFPTQICLYTSLGPTSSTSSKMNT